MPCLPATSRMSWLCSNGALMPRSPAGRQLPKSPSSRNFTWRSAPRRPGPPRAPCQCVISSTTSQSSFCALPPRTYLRTQWSAVCGAIFKTRHRLARHNGPGQGVFPVPSRPVSSRELPPGSGLWPFHLRCLGRSASMRGPATASSLPRGSSAKRLQPLRQQAVCLHLPGSAAARPECAGPWPPRVLKAEDRVVDGVPLLHHVPLVGEGLKEVRAVQLAAAAAKTTCCHTYIAFTLSLAMCSCPRATRRPCAPARRSVARQADPAAHRRVEALLVEDLCEARLMAVGKSPKVG